MKKEKTKNPNSIGVKPYAGTALMSSTHSLVSALMSSFFLLYLTDYSGLGAFGATLGSAILVFTRVFDAVNDPLEGWIIDRAKPGKNGKYRPFLLLSILLCSIGVALLFFIPQAITNKPVLVVIYVVIGYLLYDIGFSFFTPELVYRTLSLDSAVRGKLMILPRMMNMVWGMVTSALISVVTMVNVYFNNLHTSFGVTVLVICIIAAIISVIGVLMVKEKYTPEPKEDDPVKLVDVLKMFKDNDAFRNKILSTVFVGFIYTLMYATSTYYVKWAYCVDLTTGAVDTAKFGLYSLLVSMISFSPLILGTLLGTPIMKKAKTPDKAARILTLGQALPLGVMFVLQMVGILPYAPALFFVCMVIPSFCMGANYIPVGVMNMETMDYDVYKNGKDRSALNIAAGKLLEKAQSAFATAAVGVVLTAVGYVVDSKTDTFLGEFSTIPNMLTWFVVICGLIPCVFGIIGYLILRKYPITAEIREKVQSFVETRNK